MSALATALHTVNSAPKTDEARYEYRHVSYGSPAARAAQLGMVLSTISATFRVLHCWVVPKWCVLTMTKAVVILFCFKSWKMNCGLFWDVNLLLCLRRNGDASEIGLFCWRHDKSVGYQAVNWILIAAPLDRVCLS
jgi:hypothetical protein